MFHSDRMQLVGEVKWNAPGKGHGLHYIEAWHYPTMSTTCTTLNFRQGPLLNDSELDAWLMQRVSLQPQVMCCSKTEISPMNQEAYCKAG